MKPDDINVDDPVEALRAELNRVQPPPGYVARLRQRIDAEADSPVRATWWRWALPLAAAVVVLVAIAIDRPAPQAPVLSTARVEPPPSGVPALHPSTTGPAARSTAAQGARGPEVTHRAANASQPAAEPMPEIITNQAEIFRAMWARNRRATLVESTEAPPDPAAEIVVAPIEISPIVITPLTSATAPGSQPIVRPPDRDSSEGRAK